ncbi:alpha/beta hydrolase [Polaribacter sp.]|uniref:alpha/beta hydrolase n=1 Tax=Polaribacter sp. TaxID=1920175 RepID=UPI004048B5D6
MTKTPIYLMPGLAAGPEIFENLSLPQEKYEIHYLKWKKPLDLEETISNYAMRMCEDVKKVNPVLVGVSFGGILVQEMSKFLDCKKVIIISSVKTTDELPKRFKVATFGNLYKIFPTKVITHFEDFSRFFIGKTLQKRALIYKKYLSERNETYLKWAIKNVLKWQQNEEIENLIHIHGVEDKIFPINNIKNAIEIENGTHIMILNKAKKISEIIDKSLTF